MIRLLACLLAVFVFSGCQPPENSAKKKKNSRNGTLRVAVIPKGTSHEFWKSVHYGAAQAGEEFDVEVLWQGPLQEDDREGQISVMQNFITKQVDGICLAPLDSQALIATVNESNAEDIPVVIFDSRLDDESGVVSYVATDNFHGGELAAEEMVKRLHGKGNVILLRYTSGSESTTQREEGFLAELKKHSGITVLSSDQYSGITPEQALNKAQQTLIKYGDKLDGLFAVCEPNASGTLVALEEAGLAGKVVFIGFDPNERMVEALRENKMKGIVLQDPVRMGYLAVKTMAEHLRGEKIKRRIVTGEFVATPENMNEKRMAELLIPKQFGE